VLVPIVLGVILFMLGVLWFQWGVQLELTTTPGGTRATLDGKDVGKSGDPAGVLVLPHVARGSHVLALAHAGFDDWSQPISLGVFELSHPLRATLNIVSYPLTIFTEPAGSKVQVDGADAGVSGQNGEFVVPKVSRGQHVITVLHDGYPAWSKTVLFTGPASLRADLTAAAAAEKEEAFQHLQRARVLFQQRQYQAAIGECDGALRQDPSLREAADLKSQVQQTMAILGGH
jgi:hypothetical protein